MTTNVPIKPDRPKRVPVAQPLHAVQIADALLKLGTVQALTGLGKTSIYARVAAGELTAIRMGQRCTRFRASDVQAWLQAQGR